MFSPDDLIGTGIGKAALVGAGKVAPMLAGTFIGESSPLFNKATNKLAQALEAKGINSELIWPKTGNVKGPEGKWRQELSDNEATINSVPAQGGFLRDVLNHPQAHEAYEDLPYTNVRFTDFPKQSSSYNQELDTIKLGEFTNNILNEEKHNKRLAKLFSLQDKTQAPNQYLLNKAYQLVDKDTQKIADKASLLHEMTHGIQAKEGFARGGSPSQFIPDLQDKWLNANNKIKELNNAQNETYKMLEDARANRFNDPSAEKRIEALKNRYDQLLNEKLSYVKDAQIDPSEEALKQYKNLAGEAEARLVERRMNLTPEERLKHFPFKEGEFGLDVPYKDLIIKQLLNK